MARSMSLFRYLNLPAFFLSFVVGMIGVWYTDPFKRKVYIYPSPDNLHLVQYTDKTGACFEYEQSLVSCPTDSSGEKTTKIQPQV